MRSDTFHFLSAVIGIPLALSTAWGVHAFITVPEPVVVEVQKVVPVLAETTAEPEVPKQTPPPKPRMVPAVIPQPVQVPAPAPVVVQPAPAPKKLTIKPSRRTRAS